MDLWKLGTKLSQDDSRHLLGMGTQHVDSIVTQDPPPELAV